MNLLLKNLPCGNLPYENLDGAVTMMLKMYEQSPYLPFLTKIEKENIYSRTLLNIPCIKFKDGKYFFGNTTKAFPVQLVQLEHDISDLDKNIEKYAFESVFLKKYLKIIERIKPKEAVVNLLGPFSISQILKTKDDIQLLSEMCYRKFIVLFLSLRAIWIIKKIKALSPKTKPIIVLDEPFLNMAGSVKRSEDDVNQATIINLFSKVKDKIHEHGGVVCVHSFEKCDWQIPIDAGVDIISFDAFDNPNNLNIIPEKINNFLSGGGIINWAIVPIAGENYMKSLTNDFVNDKLQKTMKGLIEAGVNEHLVYSNSSVSVNSDLDELPIIFAEKAIMLCLNVSKKIPQVPSRPQP